MERIPLWIDLRHIPAKKRIPFLRTAESVGAEAILLEPEAAAGRDDAIAVVDHDLRRGEDTIGQWVVVNDKQDEQRAATTDGTVVVDARDWTIIPLENLIAARQDRPGTLYALAADANQAGVFRDTLDVGVHGIVIAPTQTSDIDATHRVLVGKGLPQVSIADIGPIALVPAKITSISDAGPGDRVCVDTTSVFEDGEGLLIGSTARSFCLVHAETIESEYVRARPFRVNAGAIHSYVMGEGGRTLYLSELAAGSRVTAVQRDGTRTVTVGRAKIEHRPHLLIHWDGSGGKGSAILQNAETIRLVRGDGTPISITDLAVGDEILVHHERAARHFGMPVDERLEER